MQEGKGEDGMQKTAGVLGEGERENYYRISVITRRVL